MLRLLAILIIVMVLIAGGLGGTDPLGRLLLSSGLPHVALPLLHDEHWRGEALFQLGMYKEAAETFRKAGLRSSFARANALALDGQYQQAVMAYDAALAADPGNIAIEENLEIVLHLMDSPTEDGSGAVTMGRTAGEHLETKNRADAMTVEEAYERVRELSKQVTRPLERRVSAAGPEWLESLVDDPGLYLKRIIAAERARRYAAGEVPPQPEDSW